MEKHKEFFSAMSHKIFLSVYDMYVLFYIWIIDSRIWFLEYKKKKKQKQIAVWENEKKTGKRKKMSVKKVFTFFDWNFAMYVGGLCMLKFCKYDFADIRSAILNITYAVFALLVLLYPVRLREELQIGKEDVGEDRSIFIIGMVIGVSLLTVELWIALLCIF